MLKRLLTIASDKIYNLPIIVLMPHSSCNCRCVMCDIWKANKNKQEISYETLLGHVAEFKNLNVREVVFSGGEALMHTNLWKLCGLLKENDIKITLLSTGLLLKKNAGNIIDSIDEVIVSLDGSGEVHDRIRKIPRAFAQLSEGIQELRKLRPDFPITGRCVLQRYNFSDFINIVKAAKNIGLNRISFLAADVSSNAFNRPQQWDDARVHEVALSEAETLEFERIVQSSFIELSEEYKTKFVAESPSKMNRIVQYYKAVNKMDIYPAVVCNAPWISAVIESDGNVLPCYFHKPYGNIYQNSFSEIINSRKAIEFRKKLNTQRDDICKKCVCSLKLGITQML